MHKFFLFSTLIFAAACTEGQEQEQNESGKQDVASPKINTIALYIKQNPGNNEPSVSKGTVGKGSLVNGKLMPWSGPNFMYFDTMSYLSDRAYVHEKAHTTTIETYKILETKLPGRKFRIMECSYKNGGKLMPHRTHQNGLSIDFMSPLMKNGQAFYDYDVKGASHYWMEFDNDGRYIKDTDVSIDFNAMATHLLTLDSVARKNGLRINKVILKTELRDELYNTPAGKKLQQSGIYVTQKLEPLINRLHDDHYHVDFEIIR